MMGTNARQVRQPSVLHLDHSVEAGGAELALVRLANGAISWEPSILLPKQRRERLGVFSNIKEGIGLATVGPPQTSGIASRTSFSGLFKFATQILGQAIAVRLSPEFRRANVIHANTSRASLYGALACLGSKKKLVLHLRDHISRDSLGALGFLAFRFIALRRANGLIGNSKSTLKTATDVMSNLSATMTVIPSPIGIPLPSEADQPVVSATTPNALRIGMIARIDPWKGQSLLIDAFASAFPHGPEQLFFAGGCLFGHEEHLMSLQNDVMSRGLEERVHFLGHVDDISQVILDMDVCVQASLRPEPLGQNVLQYLATGRAVVASDEGGPTEWITHGLNGLLFQPRDAESLAEALKSLALADGTIDRLQRAARATPGLLTDAEVSAAHGKMFGEVAR